MWWNSSRAIQNPKRWCCQSVTLSMSANLEDPVVATGLEKVNPHSNSQERSTKECSNHQTIALISRASKLMLKILHARLQHYIMKELLEVQDGVRGTRYQIVNFHWIIEKAREFQKKSTSVSSTTPKPLTVWITTNCRKLLKRQEYQTILSIFWDTCLWVKKQQLEHCME